MTAIPIDTVYGPARVYLHCAEEGVAVLMLGHGAGGGLGAKDLVAVTRAAQAAGVHVALVEQPYRVAGGRGEEQEKKNGKEGMGERESEKPLTSDF